MIVNNKIGITLSGGGFRGIAHLGALRYITELGITPNEISGASVGSLIGAFIAQGYPPDEILQFSKKEKIFSYSDLAGKGGLFNTLVFEKLVKKYIPHDSFEGLKMPLYVSVTDLTHAQSLIFNSGCLSFAVRSSCCFPLVFQPVHYRENIYLCDGGLMNNFPVEEVRTTCSKVIGINVDPVSTFEEPMTYKNIIARIIRIATSQKAIHSKDRCDIYLQPDDLDRFSTFDTKRTDEIFQCGYACAKQFEKEFLALKAFQVSGNT